MGTAKNHRLNIPKKEMESKCFLSKESNYKISHNVCLKNEKKHGNKHWRMWH